MIRLTLVLLAIGFAVRAPSFEAVRSVSSSQSPTGTAAPSAYLGNQVCGACHGEIVEKQKKAAMFMAMEPALDCSILRANPDLKFQSGTFSYKIIREGQKSLYIVSDGKTEISAPLLYGFGQGKAGQTYVYEYNGAMYESRVSFYQEIKGLDITLGYAHETPSTLSEAAGRRMSVDETRRCFGCHTTGAIAKTPTILQPQLTHLSPGVGCESCHGPGEKHVAAVKAGQKGADFIKKFGAMDGDDMTQNVCGACHRSVEDVMALPKRGGISNVRFQPYRIFNSRCYSADKRIGCTACHDPHGPLQTSTTYYDEKCMACHQTQPAGGQSAGRVCKVGRKDCAGCHMQKVELPGAHLKFTDHRIRIVRDGAPYPN